MKKHYLIVGAGLAGICTSIHLIRNGHAVTLLDSGENFGSRVAAGQINPLVFRRMTKSWRVDDLLPYAVDFYTGLEQEMKLPLYFPVTIRRLFGSVHERVMWIEKQHTDGFSHYMETITPEDDAYNLVQNDFGSARIKQSAYVHAENFLQAGRAWVAQHGKLVAGKPEHTAFNPVTGEFQGVVYDSICFCEGAWNLHNPWFGHLPVQQTKGEVLKIRSEELPENESLNRKCFVLPTGNHIFRLGATYAWNTLDTSVTEEARAELLEKITQMTDKSFEILEQLAGIRPTTSDRRPIVGRHPEFPKLLILNGLGTKGYLIAPLLAKEFADFLDGKGELNPEVKLEGFSKF